MDPSSSRDWLSCSSQMDPEEVRDVTIDNDNINSGRGLVVVEREHMFDKVVTPSDVGKLNRLVIPKQHAEKYFPLDSTNSNTGGNNGHNNNNNNNNNNNESKAGLLLNFEDTTGKSWRFRYSYWNSSQSYVMTKGWSRFVKEKQLSAGDIVSFQRAVGDDVVSRNTFFIDWRRRPPDHHHHLHHLGTAFSVHHSIPGWSSSGSGSGSGIDGGGITTPTFFLRSHPLDPHPHTHTHPNALWDRSSYRNNNDYNNYNNSNVTHLSPMNGNIMSMVPYAYGGGSRTGATSIGNPTSGSLILLRSPVPNSGSLNYHHLMPPSSSNHLNYSSLTSSGDNGPTKVYDSVPVVHGKAPLPPSSGSGAGKRSLRLFGVNMEYDHAPVNGQSSYSPPPSNTSSTSNYGGSEN